MKMDRQYLTEAINSTVGGLADALREALDDDVEVYRTVEEAMSMPAVFVAPSDPYLTFTGAAFGGVILRLSLTVVGEYGSNDDAADALNGHIAALIAALWPMGSFELAEVGQPGVIRLNGADHLAASIAITTEI